MRQTVAVGCRVVVPFGKRKFYTAIVTRLHDEPPAGCDVKSVVALLDSRPSLLPLQLRLWTWISDYYICSIGDVFKAAVPSGLKVESETLVSLNAEFEALERFSVREEKIYDLLSQNSKLEVGQIAKNCGFDDALPVVNSLLAKGAVVVSEELKSSYKPKSEIMVRLTQPYITEDGIQRAFGELKRATKQQKLLESYIDLADAYNGISKEVSRSALLRSAGIAASVLASLIKRGILEEYSKEIGRLEDAGSLALQQPKALSDAQNAALQQINNVFKEKNVCLLHGVTSCGKTEIYIKLIEETLARGEQVLYLLPEIALTTQITDRLKKIFGSRMSIYHSKFADAERVEIWNKQLSDSPYEIILGVRSSVFLPFKRLGLVIVDEEHEQSYKQQDPAPRYHARNTALVLAAMTGAKTLLGTATPSVETWFNSHEAGKYGYVAISERYGQVEMPEIHVVDVKELRRKKLMSGLFSPFLTEQIQRALDSGEQIILFQNRRGYAPMLQCRDCGWTPKCIHCDVSLTYHKTTGRLVCHYCGFTTERPSVCPKCGEREISDFGTGTEKVEERIRARFPKARVARMDLDTTRARLSFEKIIADFAQHKTDILIGTQMVTKGLDFDNVGLVGILNADTMLNYPDFRAYERAYQLMAQVAGRAGRKKGKGLVVLQTNDASNIVVEQMKNNDYESMVTNQLAERQLFRYPPYFRLIYVYLKHRYENVVEKASEAIAVNLRRTLGARVLNPGKPPLSRLQSLYVMRVVIKIEQDASVAVVRRVIAEACDRLRLSDQFKSVTVYCDVDPM